MPPSRRRTQPSPPRARAPGSRPRRLCPSRSRPPQLRMPPTGAVGPCRVPRPCAPTIGYPVCRHRTGCPPYSGPRTSSAPLPTCHCGHAWRRPCSAPRATPGPVRFSAAAHRRCPRGRRPRLRRWPLPPRPFLQRPCRHRPPRRPCRPKPPPWHGSPRQWRLRPARAARPSSRTVRRSRARRHARGRHPLRPAGPSQKLRRLRREKRTVASQRRCRPAAHRVSQTRLPRPRNRRRTRPRPVRAPTGPPASLRPRLCRPLWRPPRRLRAP
jgi:hypothetical protein